MRKVLRDEDVLVYLKELVKTGRGSIRIGEIARKFSMDSVRALGAVLRVQKRIHKP